MTGSWNAVTSWESNSRHLPPARLSLPPCLSLLTSDKQRKDDESGQRIAKMRWRNELAFVTCVQLIQPAAFTPLQVLEVIVSGHDYYSILRLVYDVDSSGGRIILRWPWRSERCNVQKVQGQLTKCSNSLDKPNTTLQPDKNTKIQKKKKKSQKIEHQQHFRKHTTFERTQHF